MGAWEDGFAAGWDKAMEAASKFGPRFSEPEARRSRVVRVKPKRRASAYSKRYGSAFKRLQKKYKTKSGAWRKGGFKACQKAAHKAAGARK